MNELIKNIGCGLVVVVITSIVTFLFTNRKNIFIWIKLLGVKEVRFSISYLFRVKIDNKYLLIKGNNIKGQYQPIGGVYKYYNSFQTKIEKWGVVPDENIPLNEENKKDLRVKVPKKNVFKFLKWFESNQNREFCVFREFYEEVLKEIPNENNLFLNNFQAEFLRRDNSGLIFSEYYQCKEILIADIFDIKLNSKQEESLKKVGKNNPNFRFCSYEEIKKKNFIEAGVSNPIGGHTIKTLENGGQ